MSSGAKAGKTSVLLKTVSMEINKSIPSALRISLFLKLLSEVYMTIDGKRVQSALSRFYLQFIELKIAGINSGQPGEDADTLL